MWKKQSLPSLNQTICFKLFHSTENTTQLLFCTQKRQHPNPKIKILWCDAPTKISGREKYHVLSSQKTGPDRNNLSVPFHVGSPFLSRCAFRRRWDSCPRFPCLNTHQSLPSPLADSRGWITQSNRNTTSERFQGRMTRHSFPAQKDWNGDVFRLGPPDHVIEDPAIDDIRTVFTGHTVGRWLPDR